MGTEQLTIHLGRFKDRRTSPTCRLDEKLEDVLDDMSFSAAEVNQIDFLCSSLERARSAIVLASLCGIDKSFRTLITCINTALRTSCSGSSLWKTNGSALAGPPWRPAEGPTISPSVVVLVPSKYRANEVLRASHRLIEAGSLPIIAGDYSFEGRFATKWQPDAADSAILTVHRVATMLGNATSKPRKVRFVVEPEVRVGNRHGLWCPSCQWANSCYSECQFDRLRRLEAKLTEMIEEALEVWERQHDSDADACEPDSSSALSVLLAMRRAWHMEKQEIEEGI